MTSQEREQLITDLQNAQAHFGTLLLSVAHDQDWQPDPENWSFRYIAAHMAACDKECYQPRIRQIASGVNPQFELYLNTGRDFSPFNLRDSVDQWAATRGEIIEFFRALPDEQLLLTGKHLEYGAITIPDYLRIGLDHDLEHIRDFEQMLAAYRQQRQTP
jgi:hypothetical protein